MFASVNAEALLRIAATRALLRTAQALEAAGPSGHPSSRTIKGLAFVQNYAVYEFVNKEGVRVLIGAANTAAVPRNQARAPLLGLALDPLFSKVIAGAEKNTWSARAELLEQTRVPDPLRIADSLFPKDGSFFRPSQLELVWSLFGIRAPIVPDNRLLGHIIEMVDTRNAIAHGSTAADAIGGRFSIKEIERRIDDTEAVCSHILLTFSAYLSGPNPFK